RRAAFSLLAAGARSAAAVAPGTAACDLAIGASRQEQGHQSDFGDGADGTDRTHASHGGPFVRAEASAPFSYLARSDRLCCGIVLARRASVVAIDMTTGPAAGQHSVCLSFDSRSRPAAVAVSPW